MNCEQLHKDVLKTPDDAAVKAHLAECAACCQFVESMKLFVSAKPNVEKYQIPKKIDDYITSEAREFIDEQKSWPTFHGKEKHVKIFYKWASFFAYAACFILIGWMLIMALSDLSTNKTEEIPSNKITVKAPVLDQEIKKWNNVDMGDDIFALNTEIEINFASLSFSDSGDNEFKNREKEEFSLYIPDLLI